MRVLTETDMALITENVFQGEEFSQIINNVKNQQDEYIIAGIIDEFIIDITQIYNEEQRDKNVTIETRSEQFLKEMGEITYKEDVSERVIEMANKIVKDLGSQRERSSVYIASRSLYTRGSGVNQR